jgi:hypothetical protein
MASTGGIRHTLWQRRWLRRVVIGGLSAVALIALLGFVAVPPIARHVAEKQLGELLGRKVGIGRIRLNPFALSLAVEDFRVFEADGTTPFFGFARLYVNAQISSVFRRAPVIQEIALESLRLHVVRTRATADAWADVGAAYNFSDIMARLAAMPKSPEPPAPPPNAAPPRFSLNNIHIDDAALIFDDRPTGDHHEVTGLSVGVPFVSTLPVYLDSFVEPGLRVAIDGTPFAIHGRTKPFQDSLETVLELRLQALDLTRYLPFVPLRLPFAVESARLSLALDVGFVRPRDGASKLTVKGDVALDKLDVKEKHKAGTRPLCTLERFAVKIGDSDLTAQRFHVAEVSIWGLDLHVRKERDGTLNLERLAPGSGEAAKHEATSEEKAAEKDEKKSAKKPKDGGAGPRFALDRFTLDRTAVHFSDESVEPAFVTDVRDIHVAVRDLSNAPGATATVEAGLHAVPGGKVTDHGTLRLEPLAANGRITVDDVELGRFAPYYQQQVAFDIGSGRVKLSAEYHFEQEKTRAIVRVSEGRVDLEDLALRRRGARDDFFKLAALGVHGAALDLDAHTVNVAEIVTHDARLRAARDARGVVDLSTLVPPPPAAAAPAKSPSAAPARPEPAPAPSWTVAVSRFDLEKWGVRFDDRAVSPAATLTVDPIALHVTNLSTAPGAKLGVDLRLGVNKTGRIQITGTSTLPPVAANLRFELRALEILPFQPYFADQVNLTVTGGTIGIKGQAAVKVVSGAAQPQMNVTADIDVNDVATADRGKNEPLLGWRSFHVGTLHVATPPMAVSIAEVALTDFHSRVVLTADGGMNLQTAFAKPGAAPSPAKTAAVPANPPPRPEARGPRPATQTAAAPPADAPMPIAIGKLILQGGQVTFNDRSIQPAYSAEISDLSGRITGLSSVAGTTADVDVHGAINRSGALAVTGKVNPLAKEIALDVQVSLKDIELPPASPYTGKYAGYAIDKGKLDLALAYKIANRKLDAQNKLVLDQFTFGDKVDSPDAVKLPVRLAVALLKDRRGVIDIDLPIAGSLDDPEFKVWGAVLKVLGNLVVKAVTAPFSMIAAAFGGGDELSRIDFAAGAAALDGTAQKRLATLGKALRERPGISFEIEGGADPKLDREGLRRLVYERKLKAKKMAALVQSGAAVASVDDLTIDPGERAALLEAAYKTETFPKPKNSVGLEKTLTPAEMETLMLGNTRVEDDDLGALALRRATAVQSALAKAVPGGASRLFLVTPRVAGPGGHAELHLKKD